MKAIVCFDKLYSTKKQVSVSSVVEIKVKLFVFFEYLKCPSSIFPIEISVFSCTSISAKFFRKVASTVIASISPPKFPTKRQSNDEKLVNSTDSPNLFVASEGSRVNAVLRLRPHKVVHSFVSNSIVFKVHCILFLWLFRLKLTLMC